MEFVVKYVMAWLLHYTPHESFDMACPNAKILFGSKRLKFRGLVNSTDGKEV